MSIRTPLARARGLGSAKSGTRHWWLQRVTALALIPLAVWFIVGVVVLGAADHAAAVAWIGHPVSAVLLILAIGFGFWHGQLGLQVVIEDYVHGEGCRIALMLAMKGAALLLAVAGILSVLRVALGGAV
ncbi:MAG: succinate dehydrogenase, hydrophobic membrane anchor protein [Alphaproteobacteria bacterium]|nr:succinate dehydrogenase, hydrophobic membrane anchor protein [Alphaproteobacteria bacterium]